MVQCPGGPARNDGDSRRMLTDAGAITAGMTSRTAIGRDVGRSSDGVTVVPAGSFAADSTEQQRWGVIGGRGLFGQCWMQQAIARSSAMAARGAATAMRAVMATATTTTQVVSRFRDTARHCMSGCGE